MSTPSNKPLDPDLLSMYAPKRVREKAADEGVDMTASDGFNPPLQPQKLDEPIRETGRDAEIIYQLECSLREMIAARQDSELPDPVPIPSPTELAANQIPSQETAGDPPLFIDDLRVPPSLVRHPLEPSPVPEPWPRSRAKARNGAVPLMLRFGLTAASAAAVAALSIHDVPSILYGTLRGPILELSSNAASVFQQGEPSIMQARAAQPEQEPRRTMPPARAPETVGVSTVSAAQSQKQAAAKSDSLGAPSPQARLENAMAPWPSSGSEGGPRSDPATALRPTQNRDHVSAGKASSSLSSSEIAMLRKQGDHYIAAGDYAGARVVLERAADAGDATAALALATTYDPVVLARFKVKGLVSEMAKANFWYERARELGSTEAPRRLEALARRE